MREAIVATPPHATRVTAESRVIRVSRCLMATRDLELPARIVSASACSNARDSSALLVFWASEMRASSMASALSARSMSRGAPPPPNRLSA